MKPRVFIRSFISLFVLAFGAWAFYEYYQSQNKKEREAEQALLLPLIELKQLKAFQINQGDKSLSALKKEKEWFLEEPIKDLMDWAELSRWFSALKQQKVQSVSVEDINWKDYYLDSAPFVQLDLEGGEKITFSVSKKSSFDGRYFIKKTGRLFLGESSFFSEVNQKNLEDFRSKKILPDLNHANRIQFKGQSQFQLNWQDYKWSLEGADPKSLPLDTSRLDGFWTDMSALKALSIKGPANSKNIKKYKLNSPQLILNLTYGDKEYLLKLSPIKEEKAFVSISHRDYIFEISKEQADKLLLPKKEIYDHNFPFNYKTALTAQAERQEGQNSFKIKKEGENWTSEEGKAVDSDKLEDWLNQIKKLRGEKYKKAIDKKAIRFIAIKDKEGRLIFELKELSQSQDSSWVQTNLWKERIAVLKEEIDNIFSQDIFVKDKAENN